MLDKLNGKEPDELTLIIEGSEVMIDSGRLIKAMDTCADAFTCNMPWEPELDPVLDEITAPFSYSECGVYIGGVLQMEGLLYNVTQSLNADGTIKKLGIFSKTANLIDSTVQKPYEQRNVTLLQRCENQCDNFSIDVEVDSGVNVGGRFSVVSANNTDPCFEHLAKIATQRGLLLSNTIDGKLLIIKPNESGFPLGTLYEDNPFTFEYKAEFNGRTRYYRYDVVSTSSSSIRARVKQSAIDSLIYEDRFITFMKPESLPGEAKNAAEWRKNKSAADSLSINFPVNTWYAPNNDLWLPNENVTIISPTLSISDGFTFLIKRVEYVYENNGTTAKLDLLPPSFYTTGILEEPWQSV